MTPDLTAEQALLALSAYQREHRPRSTDVASLITLDTALKPRCFKADIERLEKSK